VHKKNIIITSFCPLANLKQPNESEAQISALSNPVIQQIAKSKNRTTAQIIIRWHLQHGLTVIPKTITPERLHENCQIFDFTLSDNEIYQIDQLEKTNHHRFINPPMLRPIQADK
jgi:diketogulonate reductase-like aldo/keto reductase